MSAWKRKPVRELETKTPGGLVRRNVYMPPELAERLRSHSEEVYRSESDLIRDAIREYLDRHC